MRWSTGSGVRVVLAIGSFVGGCIGPSAEPSNVPEETFQDSAPQGTIVQPRVMVDDRAVMVDAANASVVRQALVDFIWGSDGFPRGLPGSVQSIASPVGGLVNVRRVDELRIEMDGGEENVAQHFIAERSNRELVVLSLGHMCSLADAGKDDPFDDTGYGQQRTIHALLEGGYSVLVTYMPHMRPGACKDVDHNTLLTLPVTTGSPIKWFVEPVAVALNYLKQSAATDDFPNYVRYSMTGLSGGGWTTTLYAALDPSIMTSIPVAGSTPLYLRSGASVGDAEQTLPDLYRIAGYPDLHVLGAMGRGRRQIQVLNRRDNCCFGESPQQYDATIHGPWDTAMRAVEHRVQGKLAELAGDGNSFRLEIDEAPRVHTISWNAVVATIRAELDGSLNEIGSATASRAFVRHKGSLWEWSMEEGWSDTSLPSAGAPAVVALEDRTELFFRSPTNVLTRAVREHERWIATSLERTVLSDPVAIRAGAGTLVGAIDRTYAPVVVRFPDIATSGETRVLSTPVRVAGYPSAVDSERGARIYARSLDGELHLFELGEQTVRDTELGPVRAGFPSAFETNSGSDVVYVHGANGLVERTRARNTSRWTTTLVASGSRLTGSLTAQVGDAERSVYARNRTGAVEVFSLDRGTWGRPLLFRTRIRDSVVVVDGRWFGTDVLGRLVLSDGDDFVRVPTP